MEFNDVPQLTKEEAVSFSEEGKYKEMSHDEIAKFQINQQLLCMPFSLFHESVEKCIGRPVFTHEFAINVQGLRDEIFKNAC